MLLCSNLMPAFIADCFQGLQLRQPEPLIQVRMDPGLLVFYDKF